MYLALGDGEIDVLIGVKVAEPFADVLHAQQFTQSRLPPFFSVLPKICPDIGAHFLDLPNFASRSGPPHKSRTKKLQAGAVSKARGM